MMAQILTDLNNFLWSQALVVLLIAVGGAFTIGSGFVQVRYFPRMFRVLTTGMRREPGYISSFQALTLSVAGRVGSGNIAGVAVAITLGGPGAVFWMWVIGLLGMATSFFECSIAQLYKRTRSEVGFIGGPAYYLLHGVGSRKLAVIYSILLLVTFGIGMVVVQAYVVAESVQATFGVSDWSVALMMVFVLSLTVLGGVSRIAAVAEWIVPLMSMAYFLVALVVVIANIQSIPDILINIVRSAFGLDSAIGGGFGVAIMHGVRRGLFSNEAGMGSAPNVAAIARVRHPIDQGIVQSLSVFIDTIIICTSTALVILLSDVYQPQADNIEGIVLTQNALAAHVGWWGSAFVSIALVLFAFTSILYNFYMGESGIVFLTKGSKKAILIFRVAALGLVFWGSLQSLEMVFGISDLTMGLLALVNLIGLIFLYRSGLRLLQDYDQQLQNGTQPNFDPLQWSDLDIDRTAWRR